MAENGNWDGKAKGGALGNLIFIKLISLAGLLPAYLLCAFVTWKYVLCDRTAGGALKRFRRNLGFTKTTWWHLFKHFYSFGLAMIDRIAFMTLKSTPFKFTYENDHYYYEAHALKKGIVVVSAHIGNWEIAGNQFATHYGTHIHAVILDNEQQKIKQVFKNVRDNRLFSTIVFSADGLAMMVPIREALKRNELVCFHGDRVINDAKVSLPFLGENAYFPTGPFLIAAITGAPILPVFLVKTGLHHFTSRTFPPIYFDDITRKNRKTRIREAMKHYVSILETVARDHPYQWFNFYTIWD